MNNMNIKGILEPLGSALNIKPGVNKGGEGDFGAVLGDALKEVNQMQLDADKAIEDLVTGKSKNLHETMITLSKAEIAFKLTMQVRNKVMEAYQEVMRTAV
ncbi:Flagellar hook-basal body complex protein FliE [hydrothermal vent metagenome]|uniref:Flagellar hook-basal body complex protein FliE n=1 Tax=hydrothermal vent metagenome TaxID=652676 RepID=A0A3B1C1H4_9ZZZZ